MLAFVVPGVVVAGAVGGGRRTEGHSLGLCPNGRPAEEHECCPSMWMHVPALRFGWRQATEARRVQIASHAAASSLIPHALLLRAVLHHTL